MAVCLSLFQPASLSLAMSSTSFSVAMRANVSRMFHIILNTLVSLFIESAAPISGEGVWKMLFGSEESAPLAQNQRGRNSEYANVLCRHGD